MGLKVVLLLGDGHARIGVQEEDTDPVMETVEAGDLDEALGAVPAVLNRARGRWEESRRNPAYQGPPTAPEPRQTAAATPRAGRTRASQQGSGQQSLF